MLYSFLVVFFLISQDNGSFFDEADTFFSTYVKDGSVDYASVKQNTAALDELVAHIADLDLSNKRVTPEFLKAFYINAYNLLVIKQVVDRYPIQGPMEVDGFFNGISHVVMGETMTLDELEKEVLYSQFQDPRLHFVLVCAARGCPPLASFSYHPERLNEQLEKRTSEVMNLDEFIRVKENETQISHIFDWYRGDFIDSHKSVLSFINAFRDKKIKPKTVDFYEYDWSLNDLQRP